jgi:hypothetical protein
MGGTFDEAVTTGLQGQRTAMEILTHLLQADTSHRHDASIRAKGRRTAGDRLAKVCPFQRSLRVRARGIRRARHRKIHYFGHFVLC